MISHILIAGGVVDDAMLTDCDMNLLVASAHSAVVPGSRQ
jgi:hypothetical protein